MPRPRAPFLLRPSRRTILLACILLLAGAVVNVAVAWVLVGAPNSWTRGGPDRAWLLAYTDEELSSMDEELLHELEPREIAQHRRTFEQARRDLRAPGDWPDLSLASIERGFGWVARHGTYGARGQRSLLFRTASGWPARSMECSDVWYEIERVPHYSHSLAPPQFLIPSGEWYPQPRHRLPLMPIPAGFAINTLFYAAILALPLSFLPIRRRLRARRGRCPACGYDLAGAPAPGGGGGGVCPECGAERSSPPFPVERRRLLRPNA